LADRLKRGLGQRIVVARMALRDDAAQLSAGLLRERVRRAGDRLVAARLRPEPVLRHIVEARRRVEQLERLRLQLDPKAPLQRGYVLVTGADGHVIRDRQVAAASPGLTLEFHDGKLEVVAAGSRAARAAPSQKPAPPEQGKLL
jgi:exodeoxyribonuclease VII large subunit